MLDHNKKLLRRLRYNRKGTAEVIGSVLFIIILMFAFSSIYLWHDSAIKTMNGVLSDKLNSQIEVNWSNDTTPTLVVTNTGGVSTSLSRLWITTNGQSSKHIYANFENLGLHIDAGTSIKIKLTGVAPPSGTEITPVTSDGSGGVNVPYKRTNAIGESFKVLTTLGNMASPRGTITVVDSNGGGNGNGGSGPVGSIIVADFDSFKCSLYSGSNLVNTTSGYSVKLSKDDVKNDTNYDIQFSVKLTNQDSNGRAVSVQSGSQMFLIGTKNSGSDTVSYKAVPITGTVDLANGASSTFNFKTKLSNLGFSSGNVGESYTFALNLVLVGTIGSSSLGQNIPFVSISITIIN